MDRRFVGESKKFRGIIKQGNKTGEHRRIIERMSSYMFLLRKHKFNQHSQFESEL